MDALNIICNVNAALPLAALLLMVAILHRNK